MGIGTTWLKRTGARWLLALTLCFSLISTYLPVSGGVAFAAGPFTVDDLNDTVDAAPGNGTCADASGKCTLRAAIMEANAWPGADTIILPAGKYTLSLAGRDENLGATGDLDILADVTIIGSNGNAEGLRSATVIDAAGIDRVFEINPSPWTTIINATFKAVTIQNGYNTSGGNYATGGGISYEATDATSTTNAGQLYIYNCVIANNSTTDPKGYGGGLELSNFTGAASALTTIEKSEITGNSAKLSIGGGIHSSGMPLVIKDSTISNNHANNHDTIGAGAGGGLHVNYNVPGSTTIQRSTFSGNQADSYGGAGIYTGRPLTVENSTISGNVAAADGGGILADTTNVTLTNVTITSNRATNSGGGVAKTGTGTVTLRNTIVSGNTGATNSAEIGGTADAATSFNNLVGSNGSGGLTNGTQGNLVGASPQLGPLADNGGLTETHKLLAGSAALDAGDNTKVAGTIDQRGRTRIVDAVGEAAPEDTIAEVDIGAYELYPTIGSIGNQSGAGGTAVNVPVTVAGTTTNVTATSSDATVVPNDAGHLSVVNPSTKTPTVTVTGATPGTSTITVTVTSDGETATSTFTMTVIKADPPQVTNATTAEDTQSTSGLVITPAAGDSTVSHFRIGAITNGRLFKNNGTTEITNGTFITNAEGAAGLKFTPAQDKNNAGGHTFSVVAQAAYDGAGAGLSDPTTASIAVTAVNDAPIGDVYTHSAVPEDSTQIAIPFAALLAGDSPGPADESSQTLSITGVAAGTGGTVSISSSNMLFTPTANFSGTASFTYTLQDSGAAPNTTQVTVNIPVTPIADTPSVTGTTTAEDTRSTTGLVIIRNAVDGAEVTHFQITGITGGKLYKNDGTTEITNGAYITATEGNAGLKFTPAANQNSSGGGTFSFTVNAATDGSGSGISGGVTATITVTDVNDAPTGLNDTLADVAEDAGPQTIPFALLTSNDSAGPADESGQYLTIVAVSNPTGGTVSISGSSVIFTAAANFNGTASFTYTVQDNGTTNGSADPKTATAAATFTVTPVNDAPVASNDTLSSVEEDSAPRTIPFADLLVNDSKGPADESGQSLTITAVSSPVGGTVTIDGTNVIFTPAADFNGTASFTYTVQDNGTTNGAPNPLTHTAVVTFTVTPAAEVPVVTSATTAEDTQSLSDLVISRNAADGPEVTHFRITGIVGGKLYKNDGTTEISDGSFITVVEGGAGLKFTPSLDANTPGGDTFTFTVQAAFDAAGTGLSGGATAWLTVTEVNDSPVGMDDALPVAGEDSAPLVVPFATLLGNDEKGSSNEGGQTLTITAVASAVGGTAVIDGSTVIFTLYPNYYGPAGFTYTVQDNGTTNGSADPKTDTATVTFTVAPAADVPVVTPATTTEDIQSTTGLVITPNAADGPEVTHFHIAGITGGKLYKNDGITEISNGSFITAAEGGVGLKFTPTADANTPAGDTFSFTVQAGLDASGAGLSGGAPVSITVTEVNDAPSGVDDTVSNVAEDSVPRTILAADLLANDTKGAVNESGQNLTISAVDNAVGGTVALAGGNVVFSPIANFHGTASFRYTLVDNGTTDGSADAKSSTAIATFEIEPIADAPQSTPANTAEDTQSTTGLVIARSAVDGAEVTHFKVTAITGGRLYKNDGTSEILNGTFITVAEGLGGLKFTPDAHRNSLADTFSFTVQAALDASGTGLSDGATVAVTVTEANEAPTGVNDALPDRVEDSGPWTIAFADLTANDLVGSNENGQALTITSVSGAVGGTVTISGTNVIFTPTPNYYGPATFTYSLKDNGTTAGVADPKSSTAVASFTVTEVNDAPVAVNDTLSDAVEDSGPWTIPFALLLGNDSPGPTNESGQHFTIIAVGGAVGGTVKIVGTDVIFTPAQDFTGTARFTYTIEDDGTTAATADPATSTAAASFTVTPVNDAPVAVNQTLSVVVGSTANGTAAATDVDGDTLSYTVVVAPTRGALTMNGAGSFTYQAQGIGTDTVTFKASDGTADSNLATITITVQPVPFMPVLTMNVAVTETRESSIVVTGTANPNYPIVVNGTQVRTDSQGAWSTTVMLVEGTNSITATNGPLTRSSTVLRDSTPPVLTLTASATETEAETVTLTASSEAGAVVEIAGQRGTTRTVALAIGTNTFIATATDRLRNVSAATVTVVRKAPPAPPRPPATVVVDPDKPAEVETDDLHVDIPPRIADEGLLIVVQVPDAASVPHGIHDVADVVLFAEVNAYKRSGNSPFHQLNRKVKLTFSYDPAKVNDPTKLRVYYFAPISKVWVNLGGVVDRIKHTITIEVDHFTLFAVAVPKDPATPSEVVPQLDALPAAVSNQSLDVTGTGTPDTQVTLMVNGAAQGTATVDQAGRFGLRATLSTGSNRLYVKGSGTLASTEVSVTYTPPVVMTDISGHWAEPSILRMVQRGVILGYTDQTFRPQNAVTRLEFAVMLARALGLAPGQEPLTFSDAADIADWGKPSLAALVKAGIIQGRGDGSFAPNATVTRVEVAVMLTRAMRFLGRDITPGTAVFGDADQIPGWALDSVRAVSRVGLMKGFIDGRFGPGDVTSRAEAATILDRLLTVPQN